METELSTDRLVIRDWTVDDADAAFAIYGAEDVTHWLTPAMDRVGDVGAMRAVLHAWQEAQPNLPPPRGRWAIERKDDGAVIGGLGIRLLPPFEEDLELDFSHALVGESRFRVNMYRQRDAVGAVFRQIPYEIKPLEDLGIPAAVSGFAQLPRGLVLVTGPTGSGKSTTLASLIDLANRSRAAHIVSAALACACA